MSTQIQRRRGTTSDHSTFTGAGGELTIDTTKNTIVVHDGSTAGGFPLAKESALASTINALTDVTVTSVASGELLKYNGSAWVNNTLAEAGIQPYDATIVVDADIGASVQAYNANNTADANLNSFVAAVTLPTADGTTGQFLKTDGSGNVTFATIPTINTLNDVGNVTITSASTGQYLQWNGSAWINAAVEAFNVQTLTTTAVTQVAIASYAVATYGGVKVVITAYDSAATERSITEIIITHDGTTAVATEYGQVNTATALATFDVDISGGNVRILATPASTNSTAFTVKAITL
jgi:hypothetical protein|tara:strand:+ start:450 stop:1331 length:882 start_codon:yes stop_codon:yes gene_type:complete